MADKTVKVKRVCYMAECGNKTGMVWLTTRDPLPGDKVPFDGSMHEIVDLLPWDVVGDNQADKKLILAP